MIRELRRGSQEARAKIFGELESSYQLDQYVQRALMKLDKDQCGVLISGQKGSGKTFFVENYLRKFEASHPVLIARHYQQHEKIPYFGFKYGISDYVSKVYNQFSKAEFQHFSASLKDHLGDTFPLLLDYIPELQLITGAVPGTSARSMLTIENQLYPLFRSLFEFLSEYSGNTVFFFTDDLQWIDASGTNLLKYLLLNVPADKLVWIGACRIPENKVSQLRQLGEELGLKNRHIGNIALKGFTQNDVRRYVELSLGVDCHEDLVDVCFKLSGGNPSHLQVLLESLRTSGFVVMRDGVGACDKDAVLLQYSGQNTEGMLLENVRKLSDAAREVLGVMACMGRFSRRTLLDWLSSDQEYLDRLLKEASDLGVISSDENDIHFSDLQMAEMLYNELPVSQRLSIHHKIASSFYARGLDSISTTELILMTMNFNQSIELVRAGGKLSVVADLNYRAGRFSQQENALGQARYFFKMSADLLKECPWEEVFEQVWLVYLERARVEYYLGEYDLAEIHLDYLLERNADPVRRARAFELKVTINNHLGRYRKVVKILKESLSELGLELPVDDQALTREVRMLSEILTRQEEGDEGEWAFVPADAERREAILRLLYVGGMGLHHTSDVLMRWAALQIILCSGKESTSGVKAIGCVSYGRMLIISGAIERGYTFGLKGLAINRQLDDFTLGCRVYGVYAFYIQPWKCPFAECYVSLDKAATAGQRSGDLIGLYILKTHRLNLHLISGRPLHELLHWDFEESYPGRELTYYITHYQMSLLKFLAGESAVFTMPRQQPSWLAAELTIQEEKFYRNYVWARYYFLFGHYELAAQAAREADNNRKLQEGSPVLPANLLIWFIAITQNWANYAEAARGALTPRIHQILNAFDLWQKHAPANYLAGWCLLQAEWARVTDAPETALAFYQRSSEASGSNLYHRALTHELWGRFLLGFSERQTEAAEHLSQAIRTYDAWGAVAKAQQLMRQYEAVLTVTHPVLKEVDQDMDMETIQYELSGDMEVTSLVKKLMVLLLRITGSTHVVVELVKDTGDRILFNDLALLNSPSGNNDRHNGKAIVPASLILMALKSQNIMVVNDLRAEKNLTDLEAIQHRGVQSFLILPVTINGHLSMVIYLESVWTEDWYTPARVRWARITANQGAVIIENARTHERSIQLNADLRKEMAEKERLAAVIEAQKDAHLKALVQTQDNERKRIASDLHDSLGAMLSTVKLRFNGLQPDFEKNVPEKTARFHDTITMLDEAIRELRQIAHNMLPVSLSRFGLKAALAAFVDQVNTSRQLKTNLQILGLDQRLPDEVEVAVYRICQELVQNVIKHARATALRIQVIDHKDSLNIIVEDDGTGIDKEHVTHGFGFTTIQSKVNLYKGSFDIESKPGKGTMVLVDLPKRGPATRT